ncbi:PEP-CTERM sorting domain-containing protein [Roseomonas alkaliterrae]|uniref:VPLPA-CTERM sorting domain-containing protein n=1 Tax=Neoroseomonas alkaliterrae TaxID=1452450 RepID=A0A840YAN1_9PROT|nr:PEP-CTERM sorting domain-containing protein [Neoroseomonas alkaliterrae]MBB5690934.1 hypothetical protein [Neoroseomonas alkaliterrae]MBR0674691.1 PEP-CTERM sorting domain-containing protein [Neoroseomonas alkaliterrae]
MLSRALTSLAGAAALAVAALLAQPAQAAVTFYSNLGQFQAATPPTTLENFSAPLNPGLTITGSHVNISGGVMNDQINDNAATSTTFAFTAPMIAFGGNFDLAGPGGRGTGILVTLDLVGGGVQVLAQQIPSSLAGGFWGFVSTVAFTAVRFSEGTQASGVETYRLDNLRYAAAPVPAPAALGLFGLGLLALGATRRRAA